MIAYRYPLQGAADHGVSEALYLPDPDGNGLDALPKIRETPSCPEVIIFTAEGEPDGAEIAIRSGAWDYIEKPPSVRALMLPLARANVERAGLLDRVAAEHLHIDLPTYRARREENLARIRAEIAYAEKERCRSSQLLAYFGETDSTDCGICDVCIDRRKGGLSQIDFQRLSDQLQQLLPPGTSLTIRELVARFPVDYEEQVLETLHYLVDEGYIVQEDARLRWRN